MGFQGSSEDALYLICLVLKNLDFVSKHIQYIEAILYRQFSIILQSFQELTITMILCRTGKFLNQKIVS